MQLRHGFYAANPISTEYAKLYLDKLAEYRRYAANDALCQEAAQLWLQLKQGSNYFRITGRKPAPLRRIRNKQDKLNKLVEQILSSPKDADVKGTPVLGTQTEGTRVCQGTPVETHSVSEEISFGGGTVRKDLQPEDYERLKAKKEEDDRRKERERILQEKLRQGTPIKQDWWDSYLDGN